MHALMVFILFIFLIFFLHDSLFSFLLLSLSYLYYNTHTHIYIYDIQHIILEYMEYLSTYKYIIFYIYIDTHKLEDWEILRYYIQMFSFEEDECRVKIQCISGQKTRVNQTEIKASSIYYFKTSLCFLYII